MTDSFVAPALEQRILRGRRLELAPGDAGELLAAAGDESIRVEVFHPAGSPADWVAVLDY